MSHQDTGFRHPSPLDYRAFTRVWTGSTLQYVNFRLFGFLLLTKKAQERQIYVRFEKAALLLLNRKIPFIGGVLPSLLALDDWKWKKQERTRYRIKIDRPRLCMACGFFVRDFYVRLKHSLTHLYEELQRAKFPSSSMKKLSLPSLSPLLLLLQRAIYWVQQADQLPSLVEQISGHSIRRAIDAHAV